MIKSMLDISIHSWGSRDNDIRMTGNSPSLGIMDLNSRLLSDLSTFHLYVSSTTMRRKYTAWIITYVDKVDIVSRGMYHCPECKLVRNLFMELPLAPIPSGPHTMEAYPDILIGGEQPLEPGPQHRHQIPEHYHQLDGGRREERATETYWEQGSFHHRKLKPSLHPWKSRLST